MTVEFLNKLQVSERHARMLTWLCYCCVHYSYNAQLAVVSAASSNLRPLRHCVRRRRWSGFLKNEYLCNVGRPNAQYRHLPNRSLRKRK